jgi:hypothetical protein
MKLVVFFYNIVYYLWSYFIYFSLCKKYLKVIVDKTIFNVEFNFENNNSTGPIFFTKATSNKK